jgi:SWI/SNF-related matrix-associated actin-dependent regulator of chromatin subfamily A-like protein 1
MLVPMRTQIEGADFLAARRRAILADEQRCGKTLAAILAADKIEARRIAVVTTASGRPGWRRAFQNEQKIERSVGLAGERAADVTIMSWQGAMTMYLPHDPDLVILDESHYAKSPGARRTTSVYGKFDGDDLFADACIVRRDTPHVWCLSATPAPHDLGDLWCMLRSLASEKLMAHNNYPNVLSFDDFRRRYCVVKPKKISPWRTIQVVVGSCNEKELRDRIGDFMLRRTQRDVGIRRPVYETMPLLVRADAAEKNLDRAAILAAAERGDTRDLDMHMGSLRRITGEIKASAIVEAAREELDSGLEKLVVMRWHDSVGEAIRAGLASYGVASIDGSTRPANRERALRDFADPAGPRVFDAQIQACGEAVDLSAASELWFAEAVFSPAMMSQAALRITNVNQRRNCFVKVCTMEGSIDDAVQNSLLRLWSGIRQVVQ